MITAYDIYGNKKNVSNNDVTYAYGYDFKNRPLSKIDSRNGLSLSYVYDYAGNVFSRTNYDNTTSEYRYDGSDRLVAERNQDFLEASYHYDPAGRLLNRILSNGSKTDYTWDDGGRLVTLKNTTANGSVINDTSYIRDRLGNITSQTDASGTTTFTYDALYRLTNADYPGTDNDQSYTYDNVGNRKTITKNGVTLAYIYDEGNRLKEIRQGSDTGPIQNSFVYDDDGNLITKKDGSEITIQSYLYDAKGRIGSITTGGIGVATTLTYDPYNYRITKSDSTGSRSYLLEGEHVEGIVSGYFWKAMYLRGAVIDEIVNAYHFEDSGWVNYTFHHDNLQSVLGLSGHEGSVLQTIQYGPFGEKIAPSGNSNNNYLHYTGREEDPDTGLYYYRARYYDPEIGRFLSEDPLGFRAGINFYAYVNNNPINANDPSGLIDIVYQPGTFSPILRNIHDTSSFNRLVVDPSTHSEIPIGPLEAVSTPISQVVNSSATTNLIQQSTVPHHGRVLPSVGSAMTELTFGGYTIYNYKHDFNKTYGNTALYVYEGQAYRSDYIGNIVFGEIAASKNVSLKTTLWGSDVAQHITNIRNGIWEGDEFRDVEAVMKGYINYSFQNTFSSAGGGFVLYPNKPNNNMMKSVYSK